ncbi:TrmH family RNA methyltransferase [Marinitenerispora sediminis]|uniref:rRNA methyltransferase n=1 Tax=Marinitenerispora sediminis TaxID=1931232 RepID=A0A368T694_9ACTN|nr:RNA methyltransferase [Marinitenerispora sediminis]RCV52216.1 rRNA methyltransferase [Marinitenerispora sediminis]RCV55601.1 rRNA methyltransferase [Marinitenerispora sediminis]RCV59196.1 rRNA methyltransferase [Marinitenerispora sediminis]
MNVIEIADAADARLADYLRLRDVNLRRSLEAEHGLFMAEGEKVVRRALHAGYRPRSVLLTERRRDLLSDLAGDLAAVPVYVVPEAVAERLVGFDLHRGVLGSFHRTPLPDLDTVLAGARRVVVLEDIVDHTNVGAIFRSAAGLGIDAVVLAPRCADPLYRRAVRVSMGAVFTLPYTRLTDWYGGLSTLRDLGFRLLALTPAPGSVPLADALAGAGPGDRHALLLGTEGEGLSARWLDQADARVRVPMADRDVDSLNVTAAAAIACYELVRSG